MSNEASERARVSGSPPKPGPVLAPDPAPGSVQRIFRNSTLNLASQGLYAAFQLAVLFVLARTLGKAGVGWYYTLIALILVVQLTLEAGVSTVLTRRIVQMPEVWKEAVAQAMGLCTVIMLASAVVLAGMGGAWVWLGGDTALLSCFVLAGAVCAAIQVERFCAGVFQAFELFGYENLARILQGGIFAALLIVLSFQVQLSLVLVLAMLGASHLVAVLFLLQSLQRRWHCLSWHLSLPAVKGWLSESVPLGMGDAMRKLTWQLDTILLALMQPAAAVGIYSVAYRPLGPLNWLPRAVFTAAFPSFARLAKGDREALDRAFANNIRLIWVVSLPIVVVISMYSEPLITVLAGREFLDAVTPLRILIWIIVLSFVSAQFRFFFTAVGKQRIFVRLVALVLLFKVVIEALLIPFWGYFGACAGSLLGELVFTGAGLAVCRRLGIAGIEWTALIRSAPAAAALGAGLWFSRGLDPALSCLTASLWTALYFILCLALGALRWNEVRCFSRSMASVFRPRCRSRRDPEPEQA